MRKGCADVGADVAAGPNIRRRRRRDVGGSFSRQVSGRCLTCSQTNCCESKKRRRTTSHHGSPFHYFAEVRSTTCKSFSAPKLKEVIRPYNSHRRFVQISTRWIATIHAGYSVTVIRYFPLFKRTCARAKTEPAVIEMLRAWNFANPAKRPRDPNAARELFMSPR